MAWVVLDFETASQCDLEECGAWVYAGHVTTEIICAGYEVEGQNPTLLTAADLLAAEELRRLAADPTVIFVAHNAAFEKAIWRKIMVPAYGFPDIPNSRWHDTTAMCAMMLLPLGLDGATRGLNLPALKDGEGRGILAKLNKANKRGYYEWKEEDLGRIYSYNLDDVRAQSGLHQRLGWAPVGERRVWLLDQRINERGVAIDLDFVHAAQAICDAASAPLIAEFRAITGLNPTQGEKVIAWCQAKGVEITSLAKEGLVKLLGKDIDKAEDDYVDLAEDFLPEDEPPGHDPHIPVDVRRALEIRQLVGSSSVKKLGRMVSVTDHDGRARGLLQYHGAGPGRWAGRLFQPQNFPRGTITLGGKPPPPRLVVDAIMTGDYEYVEATLGPAIEVVVGGLRHAIIAGPGRLLVAGDYAGIEARIVLALAGQHDKTALMASGADVYLDMASAIFGIPLEQMSKDTHPEERQVGKNSVLGLGFQMGWRKFFARYCEGRTEEFAQNVVNTYRKDWAPKVPKVWEALGEAAADTVHHCHVNEVYGVEYRMVDDWLCGRLPSGRSLWYWQPVATFKAVPWDENDVRPAFYYTARKGGRPRKVHAFGGLLTENVVQGLARDLMVHAMFKCEANNMPIVLTVHDEIVCEPEAKYADAKALRQIMQDVPQWAIDLQVPVASETWSGERYKKG